MKTQDISSIRLKAREWLDLGTESCVLDTETTGLDGKAEIVEISVLDMTGHILLDSLVCPVNPIPREAKAIHGISNSMVSEAPTWPKLYQGVKEIIGERKVLIYNASFDIRMLEQSSKLSGVYERDFISLLRNNSECVMLAYAELFGEWDHRRESWKWQKLGNAAAQCGVSSKGAHRALADCFMTLGVIESMAKAQQMNKV